MRSVQLVADARIAELEGVLANGLHPVYEGNGGDYLYDFWPNFDWGGVGNLYQLVAFYRHPRFADLRARYLARFGVDLAHGLDLSGSVLRQLEGECL